MRVDGGESTLPTQREKGKRIDDNRRRHTAPIAAPVQLRLQLAQLSSGKAVLLHSCCAGLPVLVLVWVVDACR